METRNENANNMEDTPVSVKIKLAALWAALMFLYTYGDILGFYTPGTIEHLIAGRAGNVQITDGFLVIMAFWMALPSVMVFLSMAMKASVNRWLNIVLGVLSLLALAATFLAGEISLRYAIQAGVEAVLIVAIVWNAWTWPRQTMKQKLLEFRNRKATPGETKPCGQARKAT
jgi:hypothetical protein